MKTLKTFIAENRDAHYRDIYRHPMGHYKHPYPILPATEALYGKKTMTPDNLADIHHEDDKLTVHVIRDNRTGKLRGIHTSGHAEPLSKELESARDEKHGHRRIYDHMLHFAHDQTGTRFGGGEGHRPVNTLHYSKGKLVHRENDSEEHNGQKMPIAVFK